MCNRKRFFDKAYLYIKPDLVMFNRIKQCMKIKNGTFNFEEISMKLKGLLFWVILKIEFKFEVNQSTSLKMAAINIFYWSKNNFFLDEEYKND